ncbi:MAG: DUF488 family protein, N3 subclade [Candidatus Dormibacteria bacterium]
MSQIRLRRAYDEVEAEDGARVLVDRLWPRGLARERAQLTEWLRVVAPSKELRSWYGHAEERFAEFRRRYLRELEAPDPAAGMVHLRELAGAGNLTLLTATTALQISQAAVLQRLLQGALPKLGASEEGGDPACWQRRVCPHCGSMADMDPPTLCPSCGKEIPA